MTTSRLRDPDRLAEQFDRWCTERGPFGGPRQVVEFSHASAGWANETLVITLAAPAAPAESGTTAQPGAGSAGERVVVRLPPLEPSFPEYDLSMQAAVQRAAHRGGVPAPVPATVEEDPQWLGAPFMVMPFVAGHVPAQVPMFDKAIMAASEGVQRSLVEAFVDVLAAVHALDWAAAGLGGVLRGGDPGMRDELDWWGRYLEWCGGRPLPVLVEALEWCRDRPVDPDLPVSLLWGDPRLGNLVFDDDQRVAAVLDWELATLGPAEVDLGWYLGQDRAMTQLIGRTVPGFPTRHELLERYRRRAGRPLADLGWFEVFGLFRSLAIDVRQATLARAAGAAYPTPPDGSNPLVGVLEACMAEATA